MNILFETDKLRIEHEFENAYLLEKSSGKELMFDDFYGDPECGLISENNDWAIIAGEHLTIWRANKRRKKQVVRIEDEELRWVCEMRVKNENIVELLIAPWSKRAAIWELDIESLKFSKIRNFPDYLETEYTDKIDW